MNPKIRKAIDEIERTKTKIAELQTLLPELERKRTELENNEIIRLVRSASVTPEHLSDFVEAYNASMREQAVSAAPPDEIEGKEELGNDDE